MENINETIITGRKYRVMKDKLQSLWERISFWTKATDVEFNDGTNLQDKHDNFQTDYNSLKTDYNNLKINYNNLKENVQDALGEWHTSTGGNSWSDKDGYRTLTLYVPVNMNPKELCIKSNIWIKNDNDEIVGSDIIGTIYLPTQFIYSDLVQHYRTGYYIKQGLGASINFDITKNSNVISVTLGTNSYINELNVLDSSNKDKCRVEFVVYYR